MTINNNPQPFVPFPMVYPSLGYHPHANQQPSLENDTPARIRMAMAYLEQCFIKELDRAAVTAISVEVLPGKQLTTAEANARASAANLLNDYFNGKSRADRWERAFLSRSEPAATAIGAIMGCESCHGQPGRTECPWCHGAGRVQISPYGG